MARKNDAVVSVGFQSDKKQFDAICNEIESKINSIDTDANVTVDSKKIVKELRGTVDDFKRELANAFQSASTGLIDEKTFNEFKTQILQQMNEVRNQVSDLQKQINNIKPSSELDSINTQFRDIAQNVNNANEAIKKFNGDIKVQVDTDKIKSQIKNLETSLKVMNGKGMTSYGNLRDDDLLKYGEKLVKVYTSTTNKINSLKEQLNNSKIGTNQYEELTNQLTIYEARWAESLIRIDALQQAFYRKGIDKVNVSTTSSTEFNKLIDIQNSGIREKFESLFDDIDEEEDELLKNNLDTIINNTKTKITELKQIISSGLNDITIESNVPVETNLSSSNDDASANKAISNKIELSFSTKLSTLRNQLDDMLNQLQERARANPIVTPVKLTVLSDYENSTKDNGVTKNQIKEAQKDVENVTISGLDKAYKNSVRIATTQATQLAKDSIRDVSTYFDNNPIDVRLKVSDDDITKIKNDISNGIINTEDMDVSKVIKDVKKSINSLIDEIRNISNATSEVKQESTTISYDESITQLQQVNELLGQIKTTLDNISNAGIKTDSIQEFNVDLTDIVDKFNELFKVISAVGVVLKSSIDELNITDVDKKWTVLQNKLASIANESGKINLVKQKKEISELLELYSEYYSMGGTNDISSLSSNNETAKKLEKKYGEYVSNGVTQTPNSNTDKQIQDITNVINAIQKLTDSIDTQSNTVKNEVIEAEESSKRIVDAVNTITRSVGELSEKIDKITSSSLQNGIKNAADEAQDAANAINKIFTPNTTGFSDIVSMFDVLIGRENEIDKIVENRRALADGSYATSYNISMNDGTKYSLGEDSNPQVLTSSRKVYDNITDINKAYKELTDTITRYKQVRTRIINGSELSGDIQEAADLKRKIDDLTTSPNSILIGTEQLDKAKLKLDTIESDLQGLETKKTVEVYAKSNTSDINKAYKELTDTIKSYTKVSKRVATNKAVEGDISLVKKLKKEISVLQKNPILPDDLIAESNRKLQITQQEIRVINEQTKQATLSKLTKEVDNLQIKIDKINRKKIDIGDGVEYDKTLNSLNKKFDDLKTLKDSLSSKSIVSQSDIKDVQNLESEINALIGSLNGSSAISRDKLLGKIQEYLRENSALASEFKVRLNEIISELKTMGADVPVGHLADEFYQVKNAAESAGKSGKRFLDVVKNKAWYSWAGQIANMFGIYDIIRYVKYGVETVTDLDTAFTEMRKVSNESEESLKSYQTTTFDTASEIGTTALQLQNSTADWMRLGESIDEAAESAKVSNILLNVSEFESIDDATESLVAMSQAYSDLDKMDIVDVLNNIGNNYSISTDGLATALQTSASALTTAQNDLNEAVALTTAGNAVVQDPASVGAGLRTIALRLVGTKAGKAELEELGEDTEGYITTVSKLRDTILSATKAATDDGNGFDILDENGNYKSTYEIMQGLADLYDDIVAKDSELGTNNLNLLLETIAGKNRSNIAASILQNGEMLRSVYEDAQNSQGSALEENEKFKESIEGRLTELKSSVQKFWATFIDTDLVKNVITLLTNLVNIATTITDKFQAFPVVTGIGMASLVKHFT